MLTLVNALALGRYPAKTRVKEEQARMCPDPSLDGQTRGMAKRIAVAQMFGRSVANTAGRQARTVIESDGLAAGVVATCRHIAAVSVGE